jgi:hypothetical protein
MHPSTFLKRLINHNTVVTSVFAALLSIIGSVAPAALFGTATFLYSNNAHAVSCGNFDGKVCSGTAFQYDGGFNPNAGESGLSPFAIHNGHFLKPACISGLFIFYLQEFLS